MFRAGDFNAYSQEDPIQVLTAAGYASLESTSHPDEESYVFDGMVGSLDHVLANEVAEDDVTGVDIWDINGYESVYYEYARFNTNVTNLYAPDPYRSSDHSPEIVGIDVPEVAPAPVVTASVTPKVIVVNRTRATVHVKVRRDGAAVTTGRVEVREDGRLLASERVKGGTTNVRLPRFTVAGSHELTVSYVEGTTVLAPETVTVTVRKAASDIRVLRDEAVVGKRALLEVKVKDEETGRAEGWVCIRLDGQRQAARLDDGRVTFDLGRLAAGTERIVVTYQGTDSTEGDREVVWYHVRRR